MNTTYRRSAGLLSLTVILALALPAAAMAQDRDHQGDAPRTHGTQAGHTQGAAGHAAHATPNIEAQRAPQGYTPVNRPDKADQRPQTYDKGGYNHNFKATQTYHVGPYHGGASYRYTRWQYGQTLPSRYRGQEYFLAEYWLFGLDVPPMGYEWIRYGPDAILVDTSTGEVVQVVYGDFQ